MPRKFFLDSLHVSLYSTGLGLLIGIEKPPQLKRMFVLAILGLLIIPEVLSNPLDPNNPIHPNIYQPLNLSSPIASSSPIGDKVTCFQQDGIDPPFVPTNVIDCIDASWKMIQTGICGGDFDFRRTHSRPFPLPNSFTVQSCTVWLDMTGEDEEARFNPSETQAAIGAIQSRCVARRPRLGGKTLVGPGKVMEVTIFGNRWQGVDGS